MGHKHERSFEYVKNALIIAPVLTIPTADGKFILDTDASDIAIGAELSQVQNGVERCILYCSFTLNPVQKKNCTTRKELLAVVSLLVIFVTICLVDILISARIIAVSSG